MAAATSFRAGATRALFRLLFGLSPLLATASCGEETGSPDGSETHFLSSCQATCGEEASCVCSVCTTPCARSAECAALASNAACTPLAPRVAEGRCLDGDGDGTLRASAT